MLIYPTCLPEVATAVEAYDLIPTISTPEEAIAWAAAFPRPRPVLAPQCAPSVTNGMVPREAHPQFRAVA
jgi:hypothetical protein